jgi:hypothetical protein
MDLAPSEGGKRDRRGNGSRDGEARPYLGKVRTPVTNGNRKFPESRILA